MQIEHYPPADEIEHYPPADEIETASPVQLATWYRFLRNPYDLAESQALAAIAKRFKAVGGWTPALLKQMGF